MAPESHYANMKRRGRGGRRGREWGAKVSKQTHTHRLILVVRGHFLKVIAKKLDKL